MSDVVTFRAPVASDAADLWRLARDSGSLDLNSPYAALLWCTDFADTTVVLTDGDACPVATSPGIARRPTRTRRSSGR
jgi:L-2,4-diaminobutyric acid acetyltransferase